MYMLDGSISDLMAKEIAKDSVVVFDEAHNIDDICLEVFSIDVNRKLLESA